MCLGDFHSLRYSDGPNPDILGKVRTADQENWFCQEPGDCIARGSHQKSLFMLGGRAAAKTASSSESISLIGLVSMVRPLWL
jgi:hypothetical protein